MFPSQMVCLKIVSHSNRALYPCFPHKWYTSKLFPTRIGHFIPGFLHKWYTLKLPPTQFGHFIYVFPLQMVCLKIVSYSNRPLHPCFPCKWYTSKLFPTQIGDFIHVSLANGMPQKKNSFFFFFLFTQYITQIVQIQTQHVHTHDRRDNKLIFC